MLTAKCMKCDRLLANDEIGLHKKLYNRAAQEFMCVSCSARYLEVSEELLFGKIQDFKRAGCTLFIRDGK